MGILEDTLMQAVNQGVFTPKDIPAGQRVITNQPDLAASLGDTITYLASNQPTQQQATAPKGAVSAPAPTQLNDEVFANVKKQMEIIVAETDMSKKEGLMMDLRSAMGELGAKAISDARTLAESQVGIPQLKQQLERRMQMDRAHPLWARYQSDSDETIAVRTQLNQAMGRAEQIANDMIKQNPKLAALDKSVGGFISMQERLLQSAAMRQEKKAEEVDAIIGTMSPETLDTVYQVRPDLKGDQTATADFLKQRYKDKDWRPIIDGAIPAEQFMQAGLAGNKVAEQAAVKMQAAKTGMAPDVVQKQMDVLKQFVNDAGAAEKMIKTFGLLTAEDAKKYKTLAMMPDKNSQAEAAKIRLGMADQLASKIAAGYIDRDLANWPVKPGEVSLYNLPEAAPIFEKFRASTGRDPNILEFNQAFVNQEGISKEEMIRRQDLTITAYTKALMNVNNGVFGAGIDIVGQANRLRVKGALASGNLVRDLVDGFATRLGESMSNVWR